MEGAYKEDKALESNEDEGSLKDENYLKGEELECAKAKITEAREENQKLKRSLSQIMKDYKTLQTQYNEIISREALNGSQKNNPRTQNYQETNEPHDLISLTLGRTSSSSEKVQKNEVVVNENKEDGKQKERISLQLNSKYELSSEISVKPNSESNTELAKEEGEKELAKPSGSSLRCDGDEIAQQNPTKRARVSVRVRCDAPTLNDGCQWRKYGQKIAKGNPCPRAYYRCTVAPLCPVRKQVQRCAQDMSILITTYEGTHNHPLPPSATAIVSTTSAAASMLLSGSSTSATYGATSSCNFYGVNFNPSDLSKSKQLYMPSNYSTSSTNPMITLDLTSSSSSSILNLFSSNYLSTHDSSTNLSFNPLESNPLSWNGTNQAGSSLNFGGQYSTQEQSMYKPFMQNPNPSSQQRIIESDAIAAATKAITSDPAFQSALVTALSSIVANKGNGKNIVEAYPGVSNFPPTSIQNGYNLSSSYMNRTPKTTGGQQGNVTLFQPHLINDSTSKSKSPSPSTDEDTP